MFAVVDIETTGTHPGRDKIIEIAIFLHDGEKIVDNYTTLVNPGMPIPFGITQLTGIHDDMVRQAPRFFEVAREIVRRTENCIFVAHNVRFDYSFLKKEFSELGYNYQRKNLCTVRLSQKLVPGLESYSLQRLCRSMDIQIKDRHRASGDAEATATLLGKLLRKSGEQDPANSDDSSLGGIVEGEIKAGLLPPGLSKAMITTLPDEPGVYFFHNQAGKIIYVGKSVNIRKRVISHFQVDLKSPKSIEFKNSIAAITCETTGNELLALLYESHLIKKLDPIYNYAQKRRYYGYGLTYYPDDSGYLNLKIERLADIQNPVIPVSSIMAGKGLLFNLVDKYELCQKYCGLYKTKDACFDFRVKKCHGACIHQEEADVYNERVMQAIRRFKYPYENFFVVEEGRNKDENSVVWIEDGQYMGYGYIDKEFAKNANDLRSCVELKQDNKDVQQIIRGYLKKAPRNKLIVY